MTDKLPDNTNRLKFLYFYMYTSRQMDLLEQSYTARGEAFFHVSGAGHEASVALQPHLDEQDWLHCHYRDKALMLARGISSRMFFYSLFNKESSHSRGRQMNAHMSDPARKVLSIVGPVGNSALQAVGVAQEIKEHADNPIVLCSIGEGTTQESEVTEAIAHAAREAYPVLFLIEDNSFAISTDTRKKTFFALPGGDADEFWGIPITRIDGRYAEHALEEFGPVVARMRSTRKPEIVVFSVDRLHSHTNADDQRVYRPAEEIEERALSGDPVRILRKRLLELGLPETELASEEASITERLRVEAREAQRSPEPHSTIESKRPLAASTVDTAREYRGNGESEITMLEAIRTVLDTRMGNDKRITLYGEDICDPKGDVFGITKGLTAKYPGRVSNSPLSESLIVGTSVGRALAGGRPVAFLQFADFLPIAYNQIFAELGSMYWRTDGGWEAPVIVMITAGGYRPGLGPFHASTLEAIAAHTPGIDVFMPSTAADAAGMLNAAFESERPTLFFYPKNQLNDRATATSADAQRQFVPIGKARTVRSGDHFTFVGWGNTVPLLEKAAEALDVNNVSAEVIDLRSIVPWDVQTVLSSAERTGRLIVAHEDNHTAGFGAEVVATVSEQARRAVRTRRVTRADTYVPCNFGNQLEVLPSYQRILETAVSMVGGTVVWKKAVVENSGLFQVEAAGSSPSDESITIVEWHCAAGDRVEEGGLLADMEADKASVELKSPVSGTVETLLLEEGETVPVGTPVVAIRTESAGGVEHVKPLTREDPGVPTISGMDLIASGSTSLAAGDQPATGHSGDRVCGIVEVQTRKGSRLVLNGEIAGRSNWDAADIEKRTGIAQRYWVVDGEDTVTLARDAAFQLFSSTGMDPSSLDLILFSTGTPISTTPSMATLLHHHIIQEYTDFECQAFDVNAACSGYLYALQVAHDFLSNRPDALVLVVTSEVLSKRLNMNDDGTAPIFGDAATASLVVGSAYSGDFGPVAVNVRRPVLSARGESGDTLRVPISPSDHITMDGPTIYLAAVKAMMNSLTQAAEESEVNVQKMDRYIPHQANQRIINAVRQRMKVEPERMYSNIRENGNTSSSTIPICLSELLPEREKGEIWGLTAFGGGYTYGGAILETL